MAQIIQLGRFTKSEQIDAEIATMRDCIARLEEHREKLKAGEIQASTFAVEGQGHMYSASESANYGELSAESSAMVSYAQDNGRA